MHILRNCVIEKFKIEFEIEITSSATKQQKYVHYEKAYIYTEIANSTKK